MYDIIILAFIKLYKHMYDFIKEQTSLTLQDVKKFDM